MGFRTTIKRIFGSRDKKEKQPAVEDEGPTESREESTEYRDDCSVCRAERAQGLGHRSGAVGVGEGHSKEVADRPAANLEHTTRHVSSSGEPDESQTGLGIGPSGVHQGSGGKNGKEERAIPRGHSDLKASGVGSGDQKEISSAMQDQQDTSKEPSDIQSSDRPPVNMDKRPSDLSTPGFQDKNITLPSSDVDTSPAKVRPQNLAIRPDIPSAQGRSKPSPVSPEHDKGFVGVGRTPGPSTTLMSDTKNAEDLDPFESVPGTTRSLEPGEKVLGEEPGLGAQHDAQSNNPFRTLVAPTTSSKDVKAPSAVPAAAAGGALLGAGLSGARQLGRGNEGPGTKNEDTGESSEKSGLSPQDVPGNFGSNATQSRTPSPLDRSRDRQAPPTPPLNERERSIEVGMRDEIDSQRFDPSREATPVGGHRNKSDEVAAGGAGAAGIAAGAAAIASRRHDDVDNGPTDVSQRDQLGEIGRSNTSGEVEKPLDASSSGAMHAEPDVDGAASGERDISGTSGTEVPPTQRLGVTPAGLAQPQPGQDPDFLTTSGAGADTPAATTGLEKGPDIGDTMTDSEEQQDPASSQAGQQSSSTEGQGEKARRGLGAEDMAGTTLEDGAHIDESDGTAVPPTQRLGTTPVGPAQEQTGTDNAIIPQDSSKGHSHAGALAAGAAVGAGAGALGAQEFGRGGNFDDSEEMNAKPTDMMASKPVKLNDNDTSGDDNNNEASVPSSVNAGANSASSPNTQTSRDHGNGFDMQGPSTRSTMPNFDIRDQFDERGSCSVPSSTTAASLSDADEEEVAQEDDHGMIACQRALAPQQTDSTATSTAKSATALGAGAGAGALGAAALAPSKDVHPKTDDRSLGRPRLYTIPGTNIPITPTEEQQETARAPRRMMTIPGTNAPISDDDDKNFGNTMAPTWTRNLGAPTVKAAERSSPKGQASGVQAPSEFDHAGADSSATDAPAISEAPKDVTTPDAQNKPSDQAERPSIAGNNAPQDVAEEGGLSKTGIAAISAGAAGLAAGAYGLGHANESRHEASSDHAYSSTATPSISPRAGEASTKERPEPATPSDEEAWTKLPSAMSQEGTKDVFPEDSESQYSVESPASVHQFGEEPRQGQADKEHMAAALGAGAFGTDAIAALATQPEGAQKEGAGNVPRTLSADESRNGDEKESTPLLQHRGEDQATSVSNVERPRPDEDNTGVLTGTEGDVQESLSSLAGDRRSHHSQTMPGDWDMETTEEALGDTSVAEPIATAVPITAGEERDSSTVARDGVSAIAPCDPELARANIPSDKAESAAPIHSGRADPRQHIAWDFAHEQSNKGVSTPEVVRSREVGQTSGSGIERSSFEQALASNERKNMSRTPRAPEELSSVLQDTDSSQTRALPKAGLEDDKVVGGSAGIGLDESGKSLPPREPRSESTGVATIEEPYIYKRSEALVDRPFPESAIREDIGPTFEELGQEVSDYGTEDELEEAPFFHDVTTHVVPSGLYTDSVLEKEVISHQEHYSGDVVTHNLIHDQPQAGV